MEFFGLTEYGPKNYFNDLLKEGYKEPVSEEQVGPLMKKVKETSTYPKNIERPNEVNGFAYCSFQRFLNMKRKGVMKPVGPVDMYRLPPTSSFEYGWFIGDPDLTGESWYKTHKRHPLPISPNTYILDKVKKNNRYATLF